MGFFSRRDASQAQGARSRAEQIILQSGVETDEPAPDPSLEPDLLKQHLKEYLERMDPQDFGKFNP